MKIAFHPTQPYRYGVLRCVLVVRGRNLNTSCPISVIVANKGELEMLKPESEYAPKETLVDDAVRVVIPAFPTSRATKTHLHTPVETEWVEKLDVYDIPEDLQVGHAYACKRL